VVAIKICDGYDGKVVPKEVRLLNRAQGHPNICVMNGWSDISTGVGLSVLLASPLIDRFMQSNLFAFRHPFPSNGSYALITAFIDNDPIETLFDQPSLHRIYMRDMMLGLQHLHSRGILFRDLKPSNGQ
jgi:serine/threonine protein kinase